jgi:hypothetical protein
MLTYVEDLQYRSRCSKLPILSVGSLSYVLQKGQISIILLALCVIFFQFFGTPVDIPGVHLSGRLNRQCSQICFTNSGYHLIHLVQQGVVSLTVF